jgi:flavodoxin
MRGPSTRRETRGAAESTKECAMKALVVYDTYYGNTKAVAEAIAAQVEAEGHSAELRNVRDREAAHAEGDVMFLGSPVRMGSVTGKVKRFLDKLGDGWRGKPLFVFTTTLALPENATDEQRQSQDKWDHGAGRKLRDLAKAKGLDASDDLLWVEVKGMRGPLVDTGIEETREFTRGVLSRTVSPQRV